MEETFKRIKVLAIPSDTVGGVGFFRTIQPHFQLHLQYSDDFDITIDPMAMMKGIDYIKDFDIINIHNASLYRFDFDTLKTFVTTLINDGKVIVADVDDLWSLHQQHPLYASMKLNKNDEKTVFLLSNATCVTTTTPIFADKIRTYNKNVYVLPNAINPEDKRFAVNRKKSDLLRVGFIMGASHEKDLEIMSGFIEKLPKNIIDKIQIVLCGFDTRGSMRTINKDTGEVVSRPIKPEESVWARYEKLVTGNYSIMDKNYENFLKLYVPNAQYPNVEKEHYKRCWTKDIDHYYEHYSELDVLLVPLADNDFNRYKSQLKVIESAFANVAVVASDFGPYQIDLKNAINKGGEINPDGNALLVDTKKNHKQWSKYIKMLADNPDLVKMLQENLHKTICPVYDIREVTIKRADLYKEMVAMANKNKNS